VIVKSQFTPTESASQTEEKKVSLEKLRVSFTENKVTVRFNLRNETQRIRSGFIMVSLVNKKSRSQQPISFKINQSQTYSIRRFRPFTIELPASENPSLNAISVSVWDNQQNQLIEQVYPFPPLKN